ncbi:Siroheme synthase [Wickerhamomyces ciferrii]|uniref:uroporphyrinogen-III C-methyltransferase n=1 Tax=Wickerhamomyces ciferrii (strain ATCC 14091 / BCRC 22168 / CBS 111 / JCM 3599 / NBRC 0793 / NRRL Y-1031 F-60-10) TaxID=1206466 RepID=K0KD80_WICCF|nr:Siroheme synthase [Wickerhamomyces ciferrii]CCH43060.1 Siroheme synthase [Wickerhamomyces ciferrii]
MLASLNSKDEVHLFVGVSGLTYTRVQSTLANEAHPIIITNDSNQSIPTNLKYLIQDKKIPLIERQFNIETDLLTLGRSKVGNIVDKLFVNLPSSKSILKEQIFEKCQIYRIPINTTDSPEFSTFTLLSTYQDGDFQLGLTTSGKVCETVGELRTRIQEEDRLKLAELYKEDYEKLIEMEIGEHEEDSIQNSKLNTFVSEFNMTESQKKLQRSRWLSQVVEYYPFSKLASLSIDDLSSAYHTSTETKLTPSESSNSTTRSESTQQSKQQSLNPTDQDSNTPTTDVIEKEITQDVSKKGTISLVGSGPGSISLLTLGALSEINTADIILADKLVPQQVLDLIPIKTEKFIARKFPGNAEAAQEELLNIGLESLKQGKKVVRLKQGDPYIFGRGGEEYLFFDKHGYKPIVLPGITSALSSTVNSNITATQRDVADQVLICTGTGRRGVLPNLPEFVETRTTIFLMSLHRISDLVPALISKGWDPKVPACIVERSSCPDQRVTRTRLEDLVDAVEAIGSRPPGLLVIGHACQVLNKPLTERWIVEEGAEVGESNIGNILSTLKA